MKLLELVAVPARFGNGKKSIAASATGSRRSVGMILPANGCRVDAVDPVRGSYIRIGFPEVLRRSEKSPVRFNNVGTVEVVSKLVN
jgi:hypothetical protein